MIQQLKHRPLIHLLLLLMMVLFSVRCASDESVIPDAQTHPLPNMTEGSYEITIDDLAILLPKVFSDIQWGLRKIDNQVTALRATALTASDLEVDLRAQQNATGGVNVELNVGYYDHQKEEMKFHQALQKRVKKFKTK